MRPKPRIVQCLCGPARHCITALAYEPHAGDMTEENATGRLEQFVDKAIGERLINPWCAICRARRERWVFEDRTLKFNSLEEARSFLRQAEEEQQRVNRFFEQSKN